LIEKKLKIIIKTHNLDDEADNNKVRIINELRKQNLDPKIEILIHGLEDEKTSLRVESSINFSSMGEIPSCKSDWHSIFSSCRAITYVFSHSVRIFRSSIDMSFTILPFFD